MLLPFVIAVFVAALLPVRTLAKTCTHNIASGLLIGFLYTTLTGVRELFASCTMTLTAFYFECKGSTEASATKYLKVSTEDQFIV